MLLEWYVPRALQGNLRIESYFFLKAALWVGTMVCPSEACPGNWKSQDLNPGHGAPVPSFNPNALQTPWSKPRVKIKVQKDWNKKQENILSGNFWDAYISRRINKYLFNLFYISQISGTEHMFL